MTGAAAVGERNMPRKTDVPGKIISAAFRLSEDRGWRYVTVAEIAKEAKISLAELYDIYPSKGAILRGFARRIDEQMLAGAAQTDASEAPRDRLFDVIMRRFDAMAPYKPQLAGVIRDSVAGRPLAGLCAGARLLRSMAWTLEAAGISSAGPVGRLRAKALAVIYLSTLRAWFADDSEDMAHTMAVLDRALRRAETVAEALAGGRRRRSEGREQSA
jgi:AcrR family transcriptional regulator